MCHRLWIWYHYSASRDLFLPSYICWHLYLKAKEMLGSFKGNIYVRLFLLRGRQNSLKFDPFLFLKHDHLLIGTLSSFIVNVHMNSWQWLISVRFTMSSTPINGSQDPTGDICDLVKPLEEIDVQRESMLPSRFCNAAKKIFIYLLSTDKRQWWFYLMEDTQMKERPWLIHAI